LLYALVALALGLLSIQSIFEALLLGFERQAAVAYLTLLGAISLTVACLTWWLMRWDMTSFGLAYALSVAIGGSGWLYWTSNRLGVSLQWHASLRRLGMELQRAWPIGASQVLGIAALKCPVLMLGAVTSSDAVGAYAAADMLVTATGILQGAVTSATYPRLSASFGAAPRTFRKVFWGSNLLLAIAGSLAGIVLTCWGPEFARVLFPSRDTRQIGEVLPILAWSGPSLLLVHHNIWLFAAGEMERANMRLMTCWLLTIALGVGALLPRYGLVGAAWGVLLGRTLGLGITAIAVRLSGLSRGAKP
jgi:O-antigen/teichoic acid export membrane protein